jgi:hypothetical protein
MKGRVLLRLVFTSLGVGLGIGGGMRILDAGGTAVGVVMLVLGVVSVSIAAAIKVDSSDVDA